MNVKATMKLLEIYGVCPQCGDEKIGGREGKLIVEDERFYRLCKCGYEIELDKEDLKDRNSPIL